MSAKHTPEVARCSAEVWRGKGGFRFRPCLNKAKVEHNGKPYCRIHDPVKVKSRREASMDRYRAALDAKVSRQVRVNACFRACEGLADPVAEIQAMREALRLCQQFFSRNEVSGNFQGDDEHEAWRTVLAVLAKYQGVEREG